ncbi:hypothetical protein COCOR_05221 [Corallococcus coralloides DSM 2259]|uniref:DUF4435 domain-containing protein n=1 Tax=Corallococcus coralloides (strain ATCC 25202 / DSM 2259 / NBRC 100086 / M2) TaxID=1144275 RepID=H8MU97_CORCM|nr:DUF4435 domain-containing protein [Corallococcus coralloides]AFE06260.1 hypothetical protein COCOR_05221 [Corallococcus coralloides DSM 2259]
MKDSITPHTIANLAVMLRAAQSGKKPILLTEGETDELILQHMFGERIQIVPAHGKFLASEGAKVLHDEMGHRDWFLAIVDADFDHILGIEFGHPAILVSESHDFECEYLKTRALEKTLREHGSAEKLARTLKLPADTQFSIFASHVRMEIHKPAMILGALRLINIKDQLNLDFKKLRHEKLLEPKTIELDEKSLIESIKQHNPGKKIDTKQLTTKIKLVLGENHDPWQLCQGHDLVKIFCLGLRRMWSSSSRDLDSIESSLRLSFESAFLLLSHSGRLLVSFIEKFENQASVH